MDPFVLRWLDAASQTIDAHAELNRNPDAWGVVISNRADLVPGAPHSAVVLVVPRRKFFEGLGRRLAVPVGMFPVSVVADGKVANCVMGPLIPWAGGRSKTH